MKVKISKLLLLILIVTILCAGFVACNSDSIKFYAEGKLLKKVVPNENGEFEIPSYSKEGYVSEGWFFSEDKGETLGERFTSETVVSGRGKLEVYLKLRPISYTVRFEANHEAATGEMTDQRFVYDTAGNLSPLNFSVNAMKFAGWSLTSDGERAFEDAQQVLNLAKTDGAEIVLFALWEKTDAQSVLIKYVNGDETELENVAVGGKFVEKTPEASQGMAFDGWYTAEGVYYDSNSVVLKDIEVFSKFIIEGFIIEGGYVKSYEGNCADLTIPSVFHGEAVTHIAAGAFEGNLILESCEIPDSIVSIGERAFKNCFSLNSLQIPSSVSSIGKGAVEMTPERSVIDGKLVYANTESFLLSLTLPFVGGGTQSTAFLAYIFGANSPQDNFSDPDGRLLNGELVYRYSYLPDYLNTITINSIESNNTSASNGRITDYAFYGCSEISFIEFASVVTNIGNYAFYGCENAEIDGLGALDEVGEYAFYGCKNMSGITLGGALSIGEFAFYDNKNLETVEFPEGILSIGQYAFYNCLKFDSVELPSTIVSVGRGAFGSDLSLIEMNSGVKGVFQRDSSISRVSVPFIGGGTPETSFLTHIFGAAAFDDNWLDSVGKEIEFNGETVSVNIFNFLPLGLDTVQVTGNSREVPDNAFYFCTYLVQIDFSTDILSVGESAFEGCFNANYTGLSKVVELKTRAFCNAAFFEGFDMSDLEVIGDMAFAFTAVSDFVFSQNLESIGQGAFAMTELTEVVFPESLRYIDAMAFYACNSLRSATFLARTPCEGGSNVFTVQGDDGVDYVSALSIWVPDSSEDSEPYLLYRETLAWRDYASSIFPEKFKNASGYIVEDRLLLGYIEPENAESPLSVVEVPAGADEIADFAFYNNANISKLVMPEGFRKIGKYAFYNCTVISRLSMPSTLREIDDYAFTGFFVGNNITRLYFPEGFERLGDGAFLTGYNLKIIRLPSTLKYLGYLAFGAGSNIERIYFNSINPPKIGTYTDSTGVAKTEIFAYVNVAKTIIYVPFGRFDIGENSGKTYAEVYRGTEGFSQFEQHIKSMPEGPEVGHYGDGEIFVDFDGCDGVVLSFADGTREYGVYAINGAQLNMEFAERGTINGVYIENETGRTVRINYDSETHVLSEPRYFYDSYNWTNFNLYPNGKGMFDMAGYYLTPFAWTINGGVFTISIDGNNVKPENSEFAGVKTYTGTFDPELNYITVTFMLNDVTMDYTCNEIKKDVGLGDSEKVYGTYKAYAADRPDFVIVELVFYGNGVLDLTLGGNNTYAGLTYTVEGNVVTINWITYIVKLTIDKDGDLHGDLGGMGDFTYAYEDELHENSFGGGDSE